MKKILVPVDFSDCSKQALRYATLLAAISGSKLLLVHIQGVPMTDPYMPVSTADLIDEDQQKQLISHMTTMIDDLKNEDLLTEAFGKIEIEKMVRTGFASGEINHLAGEFDVDWIVMGTQGASGIGATMLGSVTSAVLKHCAVPVLIIPESANFKGIEHIAFAFDKVPKNQALVDELIEIANYFEARLHLVHVEPSNRATHASAGATLGAFLDSGYEKTITAETIRGDDVENSLQQYCDDHHIDMLMMLRHHRSFLASLFHRSQTRLMSLHTHIPLLIYPENG